MASSFWVHWGQEAMYQASPLQVHCKDWDNELRTYQRGPFAVHFKCARQMGPPCTGLGHCQKHSKCPKSCDHNVPGQFWLSTFWMNWENGLTMDLDGSFWMFLTMYQVMWPPHTILGHVKSIRPGKPKFVQHVPDWFVQNVPSTFSQCTKLGKLKTHGKFILSTWWKFGIF